MAFTERELNRILSNFTTVSNIIKVLFLIWVDKLIQDEASIFCFDLGSLQVLVGKKNPYTHLSLINIIAHFEIFVKYHISFCVMHVGELLDK